MRLHFTPTPLAPVKRRTLSRGWSLRRVWERLAFCDVFLTWLIAAGICAAGWTWLFLFLSLGGE